MTRIANKVFEAMNELAEARHIYVREQPKYELTPKQKKKIEKHLNKAKKAIAFVEREFKKKAGKQPKKKN